MSNDLLGLKPTLEDYYNLLEKNRKLKSVGKKLLLDNIKKTKQIKKYKTKLKAKMINMYLDTLAIIKEAREYIDNHQLVFELSSKKQIKEWFGMFYKELSEILDKDKM